MKLEDIYQLYSQYFLVDTDTRKIRKNTLFFGLKGDNFNGNKFAEEAIEKGALYSFVDDKKYQTSNKIILVDNVLQTLQKLANYHRNNLVIPIIALTGSNGKTTTKELINSVLKKEYKTTATVGNFNNHIGVPLTLLSITPNTEIAIVEMGANHQQEIAFLCEIIAPDYGYITNFGKAHLEGFGGVDGVIKGKSELYNFLRKNNKTTFVNPKDKIQIDRSKGIVQIKFDESIKFLQASPFVELQFQNKKISSQLIGEYNFNNIAAAITIGQFFSVSSKNITTAIEEYVPSNNRSQIINKKNNKIILDAYNANPSSMSAALENFSVFNGKTKIAILGDMFELGESSFQEHQQISNLASSLNFDKVFLVGDNFFKIKTKDHQYKTFDDFRKYFKDNTFKNTCILIKGSRGMALERVLEYIS